MHRFPFRIFLKPLTEAFSEPCQLTNIERFAKIVKAKRGQGDSLSASFISCIKLLNAPFSSCLRNSSRTLFFFFSLPSLSFWTKPLVPKIKYQNNLLKNSDFIFYSENLMADVWRIIVKYRRKIIAEISSFIA